MTLPARPDNHHPSSLAPEREPRGAWRDGRGRDGRGRDDRGHGRPAPLRAHATAISPALAGLALAGLAISLPTSPALATPSQATPAPAPSAPPLSAPAASSPADAAQAPMQAAARQGAAPSSPATQSGMASWYGGRFFAGRKTASGERFRPDALTAAHRSLPLGTKVLVHAPVTGRSVVVRVNDRGPYARGRILDLSKKAASVLGIVHRGVTYITLTVLPPNGHPSRHVLHRSRASRSHHHG